MENTPKASPWAAAFDRMTKDPGARERSNSKVHATLANAFRARGRTDWADYHDRKAKGPTHD